MFNNVFLSFDAIIKTFRQTIKIIIQFSSKWANLQLITILIQVKSLTTIVVVTSELL